MYWTLERFHNLTAGWEIWETLHESLLFEACLSIVTWHRSRFKSGSTYGLILAVYLSTALYHSNAWYCWINRSIIDFWHRINIFIVSYQPSSSSSSSINSLCNYATIVLEETWKVLEESWYMRAIEVLEVMNLAVYVRGGTWISVVASKCYRLCVSSSWYNAQTSFMNDRLWFSMMMMRNILEFC